jgi:4Fe-4S ferredoxin
MTNGSQCKHQAGTFKPVINRNRCEGKGPCVDVCPFSVLEVSTLPRELRKGLSVIGNIKGIAHRWQQAQVVNPNACEACGLCVKACPEKAITLAMARP